MLDRLGRLAERGDVVSFEIDIPTEDPLETESTHVELVVERMDGRRIDRISMNVHDDEEGKA
jgi:hypothetical protein